MTNGNEAKTAYLQTGRKYDLYCKITLKIK